MGDADLAVGQGADVLGGEGIGLVDAEEEGEGDGGAGGGLLDRVRGGHGDGSRAPELHTSQRAVSEWTGGMRWGGGHKKK